MKLWTRDTDAWDTRYGVSNRHGQRRAVTKQSFNLDTFHLITLLSTLLKLKTSTISKSPSHQPCPTSTHKPPLAPTQTPIPNPAPPPPETEPYSKTAPPPPHLPSHTLSHHLMNLISKPKLGKRHGASLTRSLLPCVYRSRGDA